MAQYFPRGSDNDQSGYLVISNWGVVSSLPFIPDRTM